MFSCSGECSLDMFTVILAHCLMMYVSKYVFGLHCTVSNTAHTYLHAHRHNLFVHSLLYLVLIWHIVLPLMQRIWEEVRGNFREQRWWKWAMEKNTEGWYYIHSTVIITQHYVYCFPQCSHNVVKSTKCISSAKKDKWNVKMCLITPSHK